MLASKFESYIDEVFGLNLLSVTIQMKAIKQHFHVEMFVFNVIFYSLTENGKSRAKLLLHMALSVLEWVLTILPS